MSGTRRLASRLLSAVVQLVIRQPGLGKCNAAGTGFHRERLGGIVLGPWRYDRRFQAFCSTRIASLVRKTLEPRGRADEKEHREEDRGSDIRNNHCSRRDSLCVRSRAPVVSFLSSLELEASAMGRIAGRDCDTRNDFHRCRLDALAKKKIDGRRHSAVRDHASRALCGSPNYPLRRGRWS